MLEGCGVNVPFSFTIKQPEIEHDIPSSFLLCVQSGKYGVRQENLMVSKFVLT
jgi:hypothetical protein